MESIEQGWLKNEKLKYKNLRGYSEEIKRSIVEEKKLITEFNKKEREEMERDRLKMK